MSASEEEETSWSCLFHDTGGEHDGPSREHLIPRSLGGSLVGVDVTCKRCNAYFGEGLDHAMATYFEPLINTLAPLMGGQYRDRRRTVRSADGRFRLRLEAGGVVSLAGIHTEKNPDGTVSSILGPSDSRSDIERLVHLHRLKRGPKMRSLVELVGDPAVEDRHFDLQLQRRWAAKVLLCLFDRLSRDRLGAAGSIVRLPALRNARLYARDGSGGYVAVRGVPLYPLEDEIVATFRAARAPRSPFSNRALLSYDARAGQLWGLLQIAGTTPLGLCLAESADLAPSSFTVLYQKGLLAAHPDGFVRWRRTACITAGQFRAAEYPKSKGAVPSAARDALNRLALQIGRAQLHLDQEDDEIVGETLRESLVFSRRDRRRSECEVLGAAIEQVLRPRFRRSGIPDSRWAKVRSGPVDGDLDASTGGVRPGGVSRRRLKRVLELFRTEERALVREFGPPTPFTALDVTLN